MKNIFNWQVWLGIALIALSSLVYLIHYFIFRDAHHIFLYLVGDIAFVFFEVLLVTLVIHRLLHYREKKEMMNKLNMVIGAFYSEVGRELLEIFSNLDKNSSEISKELTIKDDSFEKNYVEICKNIRKHKCELEINQQKLIDLRNFLKNKRHFLLNLLENPNLLEHESFTNLLWAVFHLTEEMIQRRNLENLPDSDYLHLEGDIRRAYHYIIMEWLNYTKHLKKDYPYLFSLAVRTNPFDKNASIEVQ